MMKPNYLQLDIAVYLTLLKLFTDFMTISLLQYSVKHEQCLGGTTYLHRMVLYILKKCTVHNISDKLAPRK